MQTVNYSKKDEGRDEGAHGAMEGNVDPQAVLVASTREQDRDEQTHGAMEEKQNSEAMEEEVDSAVEAVSATPTREAKFFNACECGDLQTIQSTFHNCSKEDNQQLFNHEETLEMKVDGHKYQIQVQPLHVGSFKGHEAVVSQLLKANAGVNAVASCHSGVFDKATPLHLAALAGKVGCVGLLLSQDECNPNAQTRFGYTPLYFGAKEGHAEVCRVLLEKGAEVDAKDRRDLFTPLHLGAKEGHAEVCRVLLEKGAQPDAADGWGDTPLHLGAEGGHAEVCRVLVEKGAQPDAKDRDGKTPLHRASLYLKKVQHDKSKRMRYFLLVADCELNSPVLEDVVFSKESRRFMDDDLRDFLQLSNYPIVDLCRLQAALHRCAWLRPNVEGYCEQVEQLIDAALNMPMMDDRDIFLQAWGCKTSGDIINHLVVKMLIENQVISVLGLPQLQYHFREVFRKSRKSYWLGELDFDDQDRWLIQDWRRLPVGFVFFEFVLRLKYLALTASVAWAGENSLNLGYLSHCLLLLMTIGFMLEDILQFCTDGWGRYRNDAWNLFDLVAQAVFWGWAISNNALILSFNLFVLSFRIMHYLSLLKGVGAFVTVLMRMILDTFFFLVSFSFILVGYALMCAILLSDVDGFDSLQASVLTLFAAALGDFDFGVFQDDTTMSYEWGGVGLLSFFLLLAMVMALNMLIAILSDTYAKQAENSHGEWCLVFTAIVLESQVKEEWPDNLKLPAPLGIISLPWVWLSKWTGSVCVAQVATTVVFIVDSVVHFVVGLPWTFLLVRSNAWGWTKGSLPFHLDYVAYPFLWLIWSVVVFSIVTWNSFKDFKNSSKKAQTAPEMGKIHSDRTEEGYGALAQQKGGEEWRSAMHEVLSECPIATDDKASGQMLELMGTVRDKMMGEMGTLRGQMMGEMGTLRGQMMGEMGTLRGEMGEQIKALRGQMEEVKTFLLQRQHEK